MNEDQQIFLSNYPYLKSFIDKHKIALQNGSKEVRFTMNEYNNIITDLHALIISVAEQKEDNSELKSLLNALLAELKLLNDATTDGGTF